MPLRQEQFISRIMSSGADCDRKLQAAVLRSAIDDYREGDESAFRWIMDERGDHGMSFIGICDGLKVDAGVVRRKIFEKEVDIKKEGIGKALREYRRKAGFTQKEIGGLLGMAYQTISAIEREDFVNYSNKCKEKVKAFLEGRDLR